MKHGDVFEYLKTLNGGWVDYSDTVDGWKAGDPEAETKGIAVGWMSLTWALERAASLGANLFITHEPTFYDHWDKTPEIMAWPEVAQKKEKIDSLGMTIMRCHDLWDQVPKIGIPDSWGKKLGLGKPIEGDGYFRVYDGGGRTAIEIAREMMRNLKLLGQETAEFIGPAEKRVRRIVIGTGAITPFRKMLLEFDADLVVCTDDGFTYWNDGAYAIDRDIPVLVVNHVVAEDHGMELLAGRLREKFPAVPVHYVKEWCMYRSITAEF